MADEKPVAANDYHPRTARRSILYTATYRVLAQVGTILSYVVMVRGMAEHEFGILNLLYSILPAMGLALSLGLEQTLKRFQPEYLKLGRVDAADWLVRKIGLVRVATNVVSIALVAAIWDSVAPVFQLGPYRAEFLLFAAVIILHFQAAILTLSLSAHMLHQYSVGMSAVLAMAKLCSYAVVAHVDQLTLTNVILADTFSYACFFGGLLIAHRKLCHIPGSRYKPDRAETKRLLRYGAYNNFNDTAVIMSSSSADNFFIGALMNPLAVGAYAFGTRLNQMAGRLVPTTAFQNVIPPMLFSIPKEEAPTRLPRYFGFLLSLTLIFRFPMLAAVLVYHKELVLVLFGGKFLAYSPLLPLIFCFSLLNSIAEPATLVAQYTERPWVLLLSKISILYGIGAMLTLVPLAGVYGAALAAGTSQLLKNGMIWWNVRRWARWSNGVLSASMSIAVWGLYVLVAYGLKVLLGLSSLGNLVIGASLGAVFFLAYLRTPALSDSDRQILATLFHGREAAVLRVLGIASRASQ